MKILNKLPDGNFKFIIKPKIEDEALVNIKKRYFAMVDELARHAGYLSHEDRKLFKEQIKKELGSESLAEMEDPMSVQVKIEELCNFALTHYEYFFNPEWGETK